MWNRILFSLLLMPFVFSTEAQNIAVGQWKAHLSQNDPIDLFFADPYVYGWTDYGFFRYHLVSKETQALSKIDGFSEVGIDYAAYQDSLKTVVIGYDNGNIDLLINNATLYNVPDLLNATVIGSKAINRISFYGDYAFFSCGFGILAYNISKKESSADYQSDVIRDVRGTEVLNGYIYAATATGLYRANLPAFGISISASSWNLVSPGNIKALTSSSGLLYMLHDSVARSFDGNNFNDLVDSKDFRNLKAYNNEVFLTGDSGVHLLQESPIGFFPLNGTRSILRKAGVWYYASKGFGVIAQHNNGQLDFLSPSGPYSSGVGKMSSIGNTIYVGGGSMLSSGAVTYSYNGFYTYSDGSWNSSIRDQIQGVDTMYDIHALTTDLSNGDLWVAGLEQGIVRVRGKQVLNVYGPDNSPIKVGVTQIITGLALDKSRNLWVTNFQSPTPLLVKSPAGVWDSFPAINPQAGRILDLLIDRVGQKWMRFGGGTGTNSGILVYGDNNTPFNKSDDPFPSGKILSTAGGSGGLPDNKVNCMALDRNGQIWVGTDKGLTVFYTPSNILGNNPSDARQIVIGKGNDVGYLLGDEVINSILVDGGNRKWIASRSGLWLVSPDGQEILAYYNEDNSPLFSNEIKELGIIESTGELLVATQKGLMSLGTGSSIGAERHNQVKVYPNPVKPGYEGEISVSGLPTDAFVKITDIAGNLIYETRAVGGTATWSGRSFDGRKASTGVYLIFSGNEDGSDTFVSKVLIVN